MQKNRGEKMMAKAITSFMAGLFLLLLFPLNALATFNPSYIMPDEKFVDSDTMTEAQIQAFLVARGSFLATYKIPASQNVTYWVGDHQITSYVNSWIGPIGAEVNAQGWPVSKVIYMASQWYGVNPQVTISILQKESSMVTDPTNRTAPELFARMAWIMGYGYTESADPIVNVCDTSTNHNPTGSCAGVAMQIDWAMGSLKNWYSKSASHTLKCLSPLVSCSMGDTITIDGVKVYLGNNITGPFYRYTPHFTWSTNFRTFYTTYFGSIDYESGHANVYRFYKSDGTHFYTASEAEKTNIITKWPTIYRYEGVAYTLDTLSGKNNVPLYRFYNKKNGTHFFTASETEKNMVIARWSATYQLEGIAYNVASAGTPMYRFWNVNGTHFYTISAAERDNVIAKWPNIFKYEGVAFYVAQ